MFRNRSFINFPRGANLAFLVMILFLGFSLRFLAAWKTRIWIDEALSWALVQNADSITDLFRIPWDNNHVVNSFFMYLAGDTRSELLLRLHAVMFGTFTILVMWIASAEWGRVRQWLATTFVSLSFVPVLYGSEARGYASLLFFSLLAYLLTRRFVRQPSTTIVAAFFTVVLLGFLSHLSFAIVFLACVAWVAFENIRGTVTVRSALGMMVPSVLLLFGIAATPLLPPEIAGKGINDTPYYLLLEFLTLPFGFPEVFPFAVLGAVIIAFLLVAGWRMIRKRGWTGEDIFFAMVFACTVFGFVVGVSLGLWGIRYGVIGVLFLGIVLARALPSFALSSWLRMIVVAVFLLLFLITNGWHVFRLITVGRGDSFAAFRFMAEETGDGIVTVTSGNVSVPLQLQFYERLMPGRFVFLESEHDPLWKLNVDFRTEGSDRILLENVNGRPAEWMIIADKRHVLSPSATLSYAGTMYRYQRLFPYHAVSGYDWFLYRRIE